MKNDFTIVDAMKAAGYEGVPWGREAIRQAEEAEKSKWVPLSELPKVEEPGPTDSPTAETPDAVRPKEATVPPDSDAAIPDAGTESAEGEKWIQAQSAGCTQEISTLTGGWVGCGWAETDAAKIVATHNASVDRLLRVTEQLRARIRILEQLNVDSCEDDTEIRDLVRPILGEKATDGDSYGVPTPVDLVELLVAELQSLRQRLQKLEAAAFLLHDFCIGPGGVENILDIPDAVWVPFSVALSAPSVEVGEKKNLGEPGAQP